MAEETTTVTPQQMGGHLRAVRRRKGLSLSEVARGAGLNRRELVNYERGKAAIPESDLWVLAGSIGVDISELTPPAAPTEAASDNLPAVRHDTGAGSIGDAVAMLRRGVGVQESSPTLGTLRMLQQLPEGKSVPIKDKQLAAIAAELGGTPAAIETSVATILGCDAQEAARVRAILLSVPEGRGRRGRRAKAIAAAEAEPVARYQAPAVPPLAPSEPQPTEHAAVDVFEELARLPEPLPLPEETALPDIIATPPAPEDVVELVDADTFPSLGERFGFKQPVMADSAATLSASAAGAASALRSGADAPPIDVAMRTDDWRDSGPLTDEPLARRPLPGDPWAAGDGGDPSGPDPAPTAFDGNGWEPPAPEDGTVPVAFWEGTDDWAPGEEPRTGRDTPVEVTDGTDADSRWSFEPAAVDPWIAGGWPDGPTTDAAGPVELVDSEWPSTAFTPVDDATANPADVWADGGSDDVSDALGDSGFAGFAAPELLAPDTGWDPAPIDVADDARADDVWADDVREAPAVHVLDPLAADSGFLVDWGEADDAAPEEQPDAPVAGQWATTGTWDEPLTPAWEVRSPAPGEADDDLTATVAAETFDAFDAFAADPFAAMTEAVTEAEATDAIDTHDATDATDPAGDGELQGFSFGSDLAAALAATYLPDGSEEPEPFTAEPEALTAEPALVETEVEAAEVEAAAPAETVEVQAIEPELVETEVVEPEVVEVDEAREGEPEGVLAEWAPVEELPRIVWRADASGNVDVAVDDPTTLQPEPEPEPEPTRVDEVPEAVFVTAGPDWQLGNAVPLVEVKSEGALVMRRADERWALADVTTASDFALEVDMDFRSGPGLGLLFRASVDEQGRMSGYSFDIDPIYDGGGFLVRQWQDDRELWNPIARVPAADPNTMYGKLTVRLELHGETLTAFVNGDQVMTVEDLAQASIERDREAARGDRVGVQAWSSSDLVIDTLRVANR